MINTSLLATVSECDAALAKASTEKVNYEFRRQSLTRQIANLMNTAAETNTVAEIQARMTELDNAIAALSPGSIKDDLLIEKNNLENKLIRANNNGPVVVQGQIVMEKQLDLMVAESAVAHCDTAISEITTRKTALQSAGNAA
jgi:hypothetical protein